MMLVYADWVPVALLFSMLGFLVALVLYILYKIFGEHTLMQSAELEVNYAITTVLLVFVVVALIQTTSNTKPLIKGILETWGGGISTDILNATGHNIQYTGQTMPPMDGVKVILNTTTKKITELYSSIPFKIAELTAFSGITYYQEIWMSEPTTGGGFQAVADRLSSILKMGTFYMWVYYMLIQMINFTETYWSVLLTIGIAFRAFAPTRGAGAFLISFALGMYIIAPISYLLGVYTMVNIEQSYYPGAISSDMFSGLTKVTKTNACQIMGSNKLTSVGDMGKLINTWKRWSSFLDKMFSYITKMFGYMYTILCMLPMVTLVVVISFILSTTSLFGGVIPEISRGIVRLL